MKKSDVEVNQDAADVTVPDAGVSIAGMARSMRRWLPEGWRHEISGELTRSGSKISLRLRLNGRVISETQPDASCEPTDLPAVDCVIKSGALTLVGAVQPFIAASYHYSKGNHPSAAHLADSIIFSLPSDDENVARAYNLKGLIAMQRKDDIAAKEFFNKVKYFAIAQNNIVIVNLKRAFITNQSTDYVRAINFA